MEALWQRPRAKFSGPLVETVPMMPPRQSFDVCQYKRTDDQVFPTGGYFKGGTFGHDENLPVPNSEQVNPLFHGCIDRNA